jgi:hypothetical protein
MWSHASRDGWQVHRALCEAGGFKKRKAPPFAFCSDSSNPGLAANSRLDRHKLLKDPGHRDRRIVGRSVTVISKKNDMNLLVLIILLLLLGGGGFYWGGPVYGGSGVGLVLLVVIIIALTGGFRGQK